MTSQKSWALEAQIEARRVVTRKKVQIDLNAAFADIDAIHRTQIEAGAVAEESDQSEGSEASTEEGSCIVVVAE